MEENIKILKRIWRGLPFKDSEGRMAIENLIKTYKELKEKSNVENIIEELTKVNPSNLSEEGLKLFNTINEIIDKNKEYEKQLDLDYVDNNFIRISLIEEEIEKLKKRIEQAKPDDLMIIDYYETKMETLEKILKKCKKT